MEKKFQTLTSQDWELKSFLKMNPRKFNHKPMY